MASKILLKNDSKLALDFLRKPTYFTRPPQLTAPFSQTSIIDEHLRLPSNQKSHHPLDFLGVHQKLFTGEEGFLSVRESHGGSTLGEALWTRGRVGSSSRGKIDSEEEVDDEDIDDFDDEDFDDDGLYEDCDDDDEEEDFESDKHDDVKDKKVRRN